MGRNVFSKRGSGRFFSQRSFFSFSFFFYLVILLSSFSLLLLMSSAHLVSADEDKIFTLRSSAYVNSKYYLLGEDVVYGVTADGIEDVTFYTKCLDVSDSNTQFQIDTNFTTYRVSNNTFLTSFRINNATCQELELSAKYIKNDEIVTLNKIIRIIYYNEIPSSILSEQMDTGSWNDNAESTAYAIYALSRYNDSYSRQIEQGMNWLKENRGESDKCWTQDDCRIDITAKIQALLWLSKYNDKYRVIHDSRLWLLDMQNIIPDNVNWTFKVNATQNLTQCIFNDTATKKNSTLLTAIVLNQTNGYATKSFTPTQGGTDDILCTKNVSIRLFDHNGDLRYNASTDNLSYEIPDRCWDDDTKWNKCDFISTAFALMSDMPAENKKYAMDWMDKQIKDTAFGDYVDYKLNKTGVVDFSTKLTQTALYLYNNPTDKAVLDWLLYYQNNDGSFGNINDTFEDKLEVTVYAILAMQKAGLTDDSEAVYDAKRWIFSAVPDGNWDTVKKSSLAHVALSTFLKKYVNVNPRIIEISDSPVNVELYNPTPFYFGSLTFSFTNNLGKYLDYSELKTISSGTYKVITLQAKPVMKVGDYYGTMIIKDGTNILDEVPVVVGKKPVLSFTYENKSVIFGTKGTLNLKATIDDASYKCSISWQDSEISGDNSFTLDKKTITAKINYVLDQKITQDKQYAGEVSCVVNGKTVYSNIYPTIKQYKTQPFDLSDSIISITKHKQNYVFNITNKIDDPITVSVAFKTPEVFFEFDNSDLTISPGDTKSVTIMNLVADDVNVSTSNAIIVKSKEGVEKRITFTSDIMAKVNPKFSPLIIVYVLIGLLVLFLIFLNFFLLFRKNIIKSLPEKIRPKAKQFEKVIVGIVNKLLPENMRLSLSDDSDNVSVGKAAVKESVPLDENVDYHIADMIDIMRSLNKPDLIIRKELEQEGFSREQIESGLKEADKIITERDDKKKKKTTGAAGQVGQ